MLLSQASGSMNKGEFMKKVLILILVGLVVVCSLMSCVKPASETSTTETTTTTTGLKKPIPY